MFVKGDILVFKKRISAQNLEILENFIYNVKWIVITKLNEDETAFLDILARIYKVFYCNIDEVCEVILDE